MHTHTLDRVSRLDSPVHRLPAWLKAGAAVAFVVAVGLTPARHWPWLGAAAGALLVVAVVGRVPPGFVLRRLLVLEPLALGAAALSWFQPGGGRVFAMIVARSTLCLVAMILLGGTTPFAELLRVLRAARAPALLVTTLALMVRYLAVIADESQRMRRARQSRTLARGRAARWRGLATVAAMLFVRSSERAERVYAAMAARGWR